MSQVWISNLHLKRNVPSAYLTALTVAPGDPAGAVTAVFNPVALRKLIARAIRVAPLRAHQGDEVQNAEVDLQELHLPPGTICLRAPCTISVIEIQSVIGDYKKKHGRKGLSFLCDSL